MIVLIEPSQFNLTATVLELGLALAVTTFVSAAVTRVIGAAGHRWQLTDQPNDRSSHIRPTPTGGGLGIILGIWAGFACLLLVRAPLPAFPTWGLIAASVIIVPAVLDDVGPGFTVFQKLVLQIVGALVWIALVAPFPWITVPLLGRLEFSLPWMWVVSVFWFVFLMNVYNFMDGIDGLSAVQAITICAWLAFFLEGTFLVAFALLIAAGSGGFWIYNRKPSHIFMGDVGSLFLGLAIASLAVAGEAHGLPFWVPVLLLSVYIYDVLYTLTRRALRRENLLRAHRQHLYQRLDQLGWRHSHITAIVGMLNCALGIGLYCVLHEMHGIGVGIFATLASLIIALTIFVEAKLPVVVADR